MQPVTSSSRQIISTCFASLHFRSLACSAPLWIHDPRLCSAQTLAAKGIVLLPGNASSPTFGAPAFHPLNLWSQYSDFNHGRHTGHQYCPHQLAESWLVHRILNHSAGCTDCVESPATLPLPLLTAFPDATLRNAAEQQLTHAAENNFVRLSSPPLPNLCCVVHVVLTDTNRYLVAIPPHTCPSLGK